MKPKRLPSFAKLRVAVIILAVLAVGLVAFVSRADEAPAAPLPLKLVIANSAASPTKDNPTPDGFTTSLLIWHKADATEVAEGQLGCTNGPCSRPYSVKPNGGAELIADLPDYVDLKSFDLINAPSNIEALSLISFKHGENRSSFNVGPIGAVGQRDPSYVGPLFSNDSSASFITTFPDTWTPMKVTLYDGADPDHVLAVEFFASEPIACPKDAPADCEPLKVSQYQIQTKGVFYAEVSIGWQLPGNFDPVYGFASSGAGNNGNFISYPFGR